MPAKAQGPCMEQRPKTSADFRPQIALLTGGGDRHYSHGLAHALIARGISFDFIGSDELRSPELENNSVVRFLNLRGDQNPAAPGRAKLVRLLRYYVRLGLYALVSRAPIFHILWNNKVEFFDRTLLLLYYKLLQKRIALTAHNINRHERDGNDSWLNRFTLRVQYRLSDRIFVHTVKMKHDLERNFAVSEGKITVIPFGINNSVPETNLSPQEAREKLGVAPQTRVLLFFGSIAPYKGLEYLVEAISTLRDAGHIYRIVIAGRPKGGCVYWRNIQQQVIQRGLQELVIQRIEFIPDDDIEVYFKGADVLVLPYTHIFQSGVLFLGYNFGLPVIAADVGSFREEIVEGKTGFIFQPMNSRELAARIEQYFASDLFRNLPRRRHEIRALARERYSWDIVGNITEKAYRGLEGSRVCPHSKSGSPNSASL